jgi:hypothetical protein
MLGNIYRMVRFGPALYQSARRLKVGRLAALVIVAGAGPRGSVRTSPNASPASGARPNGA